MHQSVGQRQYHRHHALGLALAVDAALELLELGGGPGQDVDDQAVAHPLEAVDAGADRAGADQDIDISLQEADQARFVLAGVEADFPAVLHERVAKQSVDALHVVPVDGRLWLNVLADHRQRHF